MYFRLLIIKYTSQIADEVKGRTGVWSWEPMLYCKAACGIMQNTAGQMSNNVTSKMLVLIRM